MSIYITQHYQEEPSYPRNSTPIGVAILALAHLVKCTIQVKARQNVLLLLSYDAIPPYGGMAVNGLVKRPLDIAYKPF